MADETSPFQLPSIGEGATRYGKVTPEQIAQWLQPRCGIYPPICMVCANQRWTVMPEIVQFPFWWQTDQKYVYPAVVLCCDRCGNQLFLNAVTMGIVPLAKE